MRRMWLDPLWLGWAVLACADDGTTPPATGAVLVDSLVLIETDSLSVAFPLHFTLAPDGGVYVADIQTNHVVFYGANGVLERVIGRSGGGPGEFQGIGPIVLLEDSLIAVPSPRKATVNLYRMDGTFVSEVRIEANPTNGVVREGLVFFGDLRLNQNSSVTEWNPADDTFSHLLPIPAIYDSVPSLMSYNAWTAVDVSGDSVLSVYSGDPWVTIADRSGVVLGRAQPPAIRRRGFPADLGSIYGGHFDTAEIFAAHSRNFGVKKLSSGEIVVVHMDLKFVGGAVLADIFASVIGADGDSACADIPIPQSSVSTPLINFLGDTLAVLEQRIQGTSSVIVVSRYVFWVDGCSRAPTVRD